ncbi:MAG TPA: ECF transporter S component [Clostridia bacterium]|nr:ECF transporter S component [Clostridia bacterium]
MQTKQAQSIHRLTTAGVLAAAIVLLTTLVSIPMPGGFGYINLGDVGVLLAGMLLGGGWGALCAGAASALSDVLLGYTVYAPATFVIKGLVALVAGLLFAKTQKKIRFAALYPAALIVPAGYFLYELLLYGPASAIPNILFNTLQCLIGAVVATILGLMLLKTKIFAQDAASQPVCAEILREPKNGPDVVLVSLRAQAELIKKAGDMLSVQGIMARILVLDDSSAFEQLSAAQREHFLPEGKPFVRVEDPETTPKAIMQAAVEAREK